MAAIKTGSVARVGPAFVRVQTPKGGGLGAARGGPVVAEPPRALGESRAGQGSTVGLNHLQGAGEDGQPA